MPDQASHDWKVAVISALCTAAVTAACGWFTIDYQLNKGQTFWREQQRITNRDSEIRAKISFIQEIEQRGLQHSTNAFYHMLGHLNEDQDYAAEITDPVTRASTHKDHSEQLAALYSNQHVLVSRLRGIRFFFKPETIAKSERLRNELETAPWHPDYDRRAFVARLREEYNAGKDGGTEFTKTREQLTSQMRFTEYRSALSQFLDAAMQEVSSQLSKEGE